MSRSIHLQYVSIIYICIYERIEKKKLKQILKDSKIKSYVINSILPRISRSSLSWSEYCTNEFDQWPTPGLGAADCKIRSVRAISFRLTRFVECVLPLGAEGGTVIFGSEVDTIVSSRLDFNVFLDSILGVILQINIR